jgi:molecular chaperone DnaK (HSP70)
MVGGSTAVPLVQQAVAEVFGRDKVRRNVNPMECVALGAAILASTFPLQEGPAPAAPRPGPRVLGTTAQHFGIAAVEGNNPDTFAVIIPRNTPYPLSEPMKRLFYPTRENQDIIRVPVYEGLNALASLNEQQGVIEFRLPQGISTSTPVEVAFNYDASRVLTVEVRVVGKEGLSHREVLQRDRPLARQPTLVEDWREDLDPAIRLAKHFQEIYGEFMEENDRQELREGIQRGEEALERGRQHEGTQAMHLLHNKLVGSGVARQLFWAERAMSGASAEDTRTLGQAVARLRLAYKQGKKAEVAELCRELRVKVAQVMSQQQSVQRVEDKQDLKNLLRSKPGAFL